MRIDIYHHLDCVTNEKLDRILHNQETLMAVITDLQTEVADERTVTQSAITLLEGLSAQIAQLKNDPVALQQLVDDMRANKQSLADAVAANTPTQP